MELIRCSYFDSLNLVQPNAIAGIPCAGIGENDLVARLKTALNFNRVDRALAKFHRRAHSFRAAANQFEHTHGVVLLTEGWPAHINDVIEVFELDCSVHAQIGARALRQRLIEGNLDSYGSLLHCWIDARNVPLRSTVASVDYRFLFDLNILRLRFSDFDLRLQLRWVRDASKIVADLESLADLHRQLLQHARHSGFHVQRFNLSELQFCQLIRLIDCGLFRGQLRLDRIARKCQALLLDLIALLAFLFFNLRSFVN